MQISFDAGNERELAAVQALIGVLRGESLLLSGETIKGTLHVDTEGYVSGFEINGAAGGSFLVPPAQHADGPPLNDPERRYIPLPDADDAPDPAQAFGVNPTPAQIADIAPAPDGSTPTPSSDGAERDADGLPWDERIHSNPATINASDGKWRAKRGIKDQPELLASVTAELLGSPPSPPPAPPALAVPTPPAPDAPPVAPTAAQTAPVPTPPVAPMASGPDAAGSAPSFAEFMKKLTGLQSSGKLTVAQTAELCQSLGLTGVRDLIKSPDMIAALDALVDEHVASPRA